MQTNQYMLGIAVHENIPHSLLKQGAILHVAAVQDLAEELFQTACSWMDNEIVSP